MNRRGLTVLLICAALISSSCTRISEGEPTAGTDRRATTSAPRTSTATTPATTPPAPQDDPEPGVVPTTAPPAPAGTVCAPDALPPVRTVARVPDPDAPTATVGVPDGWSMSSGQGDTEGARLEGPDSMEAVITIEATDLDPPAAFRQWIDFITADATVSTVSTLPAEMCGYSGQRLMGMLSNDQLSVNYRDRLVHVPSGSKNYLIVVHVEAPMDTPGFDEPATLLTEDFEIGIP